MACPETATFKHKREIFWKSGGFKKSRLLNNSSSSLVVALAARMVLLGQEDGLDVRQHTSLGDGNTRQKLVQLFVVSDGQLQMARVDPLLLVVTSCVTRQLEDLGSEVLHHSCKVDWSTSTDPFGIVATAEETVNTADGELEPCTARASLGLGAGLASLSTSRHDSARR